jgi:hypothetical protein
MCWRGWRGRRFSLRILIIDIFGVGVRVHSMIRAERDGWYVTYEGFIAICFRVLNEGNDRALPLFDRSILAR